MTRSVEIPEADRRISPAVLADTIQAMMCGAVDRGPSVERSDCESTADVIIDSFAACGFLVAVPQPVDREALVALMNAHAIEAFNGSRVVCECNLTWVTNAEYRAHLADTVLAALAGEQERAEIPK